MRKHLVLYLLVSSTYIVKATGQGFTLHDILSYPYPTELVSSTQGAMIAWAFNEQGIRNVYVAEGPAFAPRKLTSYAADDGQEITSLSISKNGQWVIFVRGGDHGGNNEQSTAVNPAILPETPKVQVWSVPFTGGESKVLGEGDYPQVSPKGDQVAFIKGGQVWSAPIDGASPSKSLFNMRGINSAIQWSPDGLSLAFVSTRTDHSFIGIFSKTTDSIKWISPSFSRDVSPRWSPDGKKIAFVRTPGSGGAPDSILVEHLRAWAIWTADVSSGNASMIWKSPNTLRGSVPTTDGGFNLNWVAGDRLVFLSYQDGWPHLYSIPAMGGLPLLLTPGSFMVEQLSLSADRKWMVFSVNTGPDKLDIDRRHIARVPVGEAAMEIVTKGVELETYPVITGDGSTIAFFSASAQRPLLPAIMPSNKGGLKLLGSDHIPTRFPISQLVTPKQVVFKAPDGTNVHAQLFEPPRAKSKRPAIVYVHGGPQRQMVLGWHFMDYYSIDYALNQYLVSLGFSVLSVNYRMGVGYGYEFNRPPHAGAFGASEYQDIKAAGEWLASQPEIDNKRIGIYGGSYGGFLTALALGRDSKLFAAGVDIHGVHNRTRTAALTRSEQAPDEELAAKVALESSPIAYVNTWTSPVLIIHADDDRNVPFSQSVDLVRRFEDKGLPFEYLAIPDDTHHWMKFSNAVKVCEATAEFLKRQLIR